MKRMVYEIGILVVTVLLYAMPILTACSFIYDWYTGVQFTLIVTSIIELIGLSCLVDFMADFGGAE